MKKILVVLTMATIFSGMLLSCASTKTQESGVVTSAAVSGDSVSASTEDK